MGQDATSNAELLRLVRGLRRARRAFIEAAVRLSDEQLDRVIDESGWTARRLIEYCRAVERHHFTRMYHFFHEEVKVYDSPAASMDHVGVEKPEVALAGECSEVWLAGRETEMWVDLLLGEDLDEVRGATQGWPQGGWTIREVFGRVGKVYRTKATIL